MWISVKMSVVISMSMNQSSSFEESCPSNMGISCSRVVMVFAWFLCLAHKMFVYACIVVCMGSSLGGGWMWLEYHSEVLQFISKLIQLGHRCRSVGGTF